MHNAKALQHLTQWDSRPNATLSLYLALDQNREGRLQAMGHLVKGKELKIKNNGDPEGWVKLAPDLKRAAKFVEDLPLGPDRGLILFSSEGAGLFEAYTLPYLVPNVLEVGPSPYIRPLTALVSDMKLTMTVLMDGKEARFFLSSMAGMHELKKARLEFAPSQAQRDGQSGRAGGNRVERKSDEALARSAKETVAQLMEMKDDFEQLVLGGSPSALEALNQQMHSYLAGRLAGTFQSETQLSTTAVAEKVEDILKAARKERQGKLLASLADNMGPGGKALAGLNQVLAALHEGRVHTLLVRRGFTSPGGSCASCGRLRHMAGDCPICGQEMTPVDDVVNLAMARAIEQGADLEQVGGDSALDELGGVAALLRYV